MGGKKNYALVPADVLCFHLVCWPLSGICCHKKKKRQPQLVEHMKTY